MTLLTVSNIYAETQAKPILKNFNISINEGEIHVIMGPNGSGKSTLTKILAGHPDYKVISGELLFINENLQNLSPEDRAKKGLFLAFQSPIEIPGLTCFDFFHLIYNENLSFHGKESVSPLEFLPIIKSIFAKVGSNDDLLERNFNEGFSGGEKKRSEIIQMLLLKPKLAILDEIDSGLDLDTLKKICNVLRHQKKTAFLIITHNPKMVELMNPDFVHVFFNGKIQKTGGKKLVYELDQKGYKHFDTL